MRCLRLLTVAAALVGLSVSATPAAAGDLAAAVRVANAVYPGVARECGTVTIEHHPLSAPNAADEDAVAEAYEGECRVRIKPGIAAAYSDARVCSLVTHEWGHLAGRRFPENASDPAHSPNPADNMYGGWVVHHPACGESDSARLTRERREKDASVAAQNAASLREHRGEEIRDMLGDLREQLRAAKRKTRGAHGARRAGQARRVRRLRHAIRRLRAEYCSLGLCGSRVRM